MNRINCLKNLNDTFAQERKVREAAVGETVSWILDQLDGGTSEE